MNIQQIIDPLHRMKNRENESGWLREYEAVCGDLWTVYKLLENVFPEIVRNIEHLYKGFGIYVRTVQAIDRHLKRIRDRTAYLKILKDEIDVAQANTITAQINMNTENVHRYYDDVFRNSNTTIKLDRDAEKVSIKTKCREYFDAVQSLHDLMKTRGDGLAEIRL